MKDRNHFSYGKLMLMVIGMTVLNGYGCENNFEPHVENGNSVVAGVASRSIEVTPRQELC